MHMRHNTKVPQCLLSPHTGISLVNRALQARLRIKYTFTVHLPSNGFVIAFSDVSINSHKRYSMNIGETDVMHIVKVFREGPQNFRM